MSYFSHCLTNIYHAWSELSEIFSHGVRNNKYSHGLSYFPTVWNNFIRTKLSYFSPVWTIFQRSEMFANATWGPWRPLHRFRRRRCRPAGGWSGSSARRTRRSTPGHETGGSLKGMISQYILQNLPYSHFNEHALKGQSLLYTIMSL